MTAAEMSPAGLAGLVLLGLILLLWPLAIFTNFRGYRDSHARRSFKAARFGRGGELTPGDKLFATVTQLIVASGLALAGSALIVHVVWTALDRVL